jgi:hypothetical protein
MKYPPSPPPHFIRLISKYFLRQLLSICEICSCLKVADQVSNYANQLATLNIAMLLSHSFVFWEAGGFIIFLLDSNKVER